MPNHRALAIANEFIRRNGGPLNQWQLQKLVYLAHGWNLAINREPLVSDWVEAWDGGPVYRVIWNHMRDHGYNTADAILRNPESHEPYEADITERERAVIEHVWRKYGNESGLALSKMTHQVGTPWTNTYFGKGRNSHIPNDEIRKHFVELALAGRARVAGAAS